MEAKRVAVAAVRVTEGLELEQQVDWDQVEQMVV